MTDLLKPVTNYELDTSKIKVGDVVTVKRTNKDTPLGGQRNEPDRGLVTTANSSYITVNTVRNGSFMIWVADLMKDKYKVEVLRVIEQKEEED